MATKARSTTAPWTRKEIGSWREYQDVIEQYLTGRWLFRGVASVDYPLVPSVGRVRTEFRYEPNIETDLFEQFKREALPLLPSRPQNDWEWLALAQHFGMPTRLLDWSESPYVALFFAVLAQDDLHGSLYIIPRPKHASLDPAKGPFQVKDVSFFYPSYVTSRLVSQRGLFTIHPEPAAAYNHPDMLQLVIGNSSKRDFRAKLDTVGVHQAAIFADLDGLSKRLVAMRGYQEPPPTATAGVPAPLSGGPTPAGVKINPNDPQQGQWGGKASVNGWRLSAEVWPISEGWYGIELKVAPDGPGRKKALTRPVSFHLHDSFLEPAQVIRPAKGKAVLETEAYGAFTVGAHVIQDGTLLELNLAEVRHAPREFKTR